MCARVCVFGAGAIRQSRMTTAAAAAAAEQSEEKGNEVKPTLFLYVDCSWLLFVFPFGLFLLGSVREKMYVLRRINIVYTCKRMVRESLS